MNETQTTRGVSSISVENIGGIDETTVQFSPGVTVLAGRNATNRTSLLKAVMAAMGSDDVPLKGDADEGHVSLTIDGETYTRTARREGESVVLDGDPYLDDPATADRFAFLLEMNDARQAVARGDDLRDIIMGPVDTEAISAEVSRLESEKREIADRLRELESLEDELPELAEERAQLEQRLDEKREQLAAKRAEIDERDRDLEETRDEKAELDEKLDELGRVRSELEQVRHKLDTERESRERLTEEREGFEEQLEALPELPGGEIAEYESKIERLRERKQTLESDISELQSIIGFNEEMLEGSGSAALDGGSLESDGSVTDQLLDDSQVACWTCGTTVAREQIETTIDRLQSLRQEKVSKNRELREELDGYKESIRELESQRTEREQLERRLERTEQELEERAERIESLKSERERLTGRIETLEETVAELETEEFGDILELHKEANQLEFEIETIEDDIETLDERRAEIEARLDEREAIEERREELQDELVELRTRIERLETDAIEEFNEGMDTVLDLLDYGNLERIWLERTERQVREGRRTVTKSVFDLHIVRTTDTGAAYEDTVDHLSESEREVTGLLFGLAGYLVHDLESVCPFMLIDSLEAIDAGRIAKLVEYFERHTDHLVVALLPEDAAGLDDSYTRIEEI